MQKIFWTPNTHAEQPAILIINDVVAANTGTDEQNLAMVKIGEVRQWPCEKAVSEQKGKKFSKDLIISLRSEGIVIRSTFQQSDNNRPLPYMYYTVNTDIEQAIEDLKRYAEQTQHTLNLSELESAIEEIANYHTQARDKERERLTSLGGGWEKLWYHVRRH